MCAQPAPAPAICALISRTDWLEMVDQKHRYGACGDPTLARL
jgi:hypothetical protein